MRRALFAIIIAAPLVTSGSGLLEPLWHMLSSVWGASETLDGGCIMDPSGLCRPAPAPQPDEGCIWDPSGCPQGS
jgi:hypothetical protein